MRRTLDPSVLAQFVHHSYLFSLSPQVCTHCGTISAKEEILELWLHPSHGRDNKMVQYRPLGGPLRESLPVAFHSHPQRTTPACVECITSTRPPFTEGELVMYATNLRAFRAQANLEAKRVEAGKPALPTRRPASRRIPTTEELFD